MPCISHFVNRWTPLDIYPISIKNYYKNAMLQMGELDTSQPRRREQKMLHLIEFEKLLLLFNFEFQAILCFLF